MITLDDHILELLQAGEIDRATALEFAQDPRDLEARL